MFIYRIIQTIEKTEKTVIMPELDILAISTYIPNRSKVTICSIYLPPNMTFTSNQLDSLIQQLPSSIILVRDMNSYSTLWEFHHTDSRGRKKILNDNKILLNGYKPTHFCRRTGSFSTTDLSICDATLTPRITWYFLNFVAMDTYVSKSPSLMP